MIKSIKLFLVLCTAMVSGQDAVEGKIGTVQEDGLYRIPVPHEVRSYAATDLRDFRIWDTNDNQVPYFVQPANTYKRTKVSDFTEFPIISRTRKTDTSATYIIKNPYKTVDQAVLLISNYQGSKNYRLEGSNDQKQWFGILNNGLLNQLNHPKRTSVYKVIDFPLCTYRYLKLVFNDRHSLPLNLLKIGKANAEVITTAPLTMGEIPIKAIEFLDKEKKTQVQISLERPEVINQIKIDITAPDLYSRNATFYTIKEGKKPYREQLATFSIRSDKDLVFSIPRCKEKMVYLEIDNKDNPKLQISEIHLLQTPIYLVAALKKHEKYKVTAGNKKRSTPDYDLSAVTNTLKSVLPITQINSIVYLESERITETKISFWEQSWFMWCCIGFSAFIISYFTLNLVKDLNRNKEV